MSVTQIGAARPPYIAFITFMRFLQRMAEAPAELPVRIDASVLKHMSGGGQSQLLIALRYFDLVVGEDDAATDRLSQVVRMDESELRSWLAEEIQSRYGSAMELSHRSGTGKQLGELFEAEFGYRGSTRDKAIRFFLQAAQFAGLSVSPHFSVPRASTTRSSGRKTGRTREEAEETAVTTAPRLDPAIQALVNKLPKAGDPWRLEDRDRWMAALNAILDIVYEPDDGGSDTY